MITFKREVLGKASCFDCDHCRKTMFVAYVVASTEYPTEGLSLCGKCVKLLPKLLTEWLDGNYGRASQQRIAEEGGRTSAIAPPDQLSDVREDRVD